MAEERDSAESLSLDDSTYQYVHAQSPVQSPVQQHELNNSNNGSSSNDSSFGKARGMPSPSLLLSSLFPSPPCLLSLYYSFFLRFLLLPLTLHVTQHQNQYLR
jgi:hypothetical protein